MRAIRQFGCAVLLAIFFSAAVSAQDPEMQAVFRVKYIAEDAVYLNAGRNANLLEGQKLTVKRADTTTLPSGTSEVRAVRIIAQLEITSVAESSAVCEIRSRNDEIQVGDLAYLSSEDLQKLVEQRALGSTRRYPQVITFTEGDPLDEEQRESVPRPPLAEVNRTRGRIGFDYSSISGHNSPGTRSSQFGIVLRADMTRIGGSYWNFTGYWRGRLSSRSDSQPQTITDLVNRTYQLGLFYVNPNSRWVAGVGRLYVPWATSLNTLDGGYFGRRVGKNVTIGLFAGTTPDPTSWNYNPNRRIAGGFVAFEGGSFESFRYNSTIGLGVSAIRWRIDRPFLFFENGFFYKRYLSIYHSLEADRPRVSLPAATGSTSSPNTAGISRSYLTVRIQPHRRFSFDVNHNYFRDFPTFDSTLISTGLVDKLLFQGLSTGARVELPYRLSLYTSIGRSTRTGDAKSSWNQMYGVTLGEVWNTGVRADFRYSKFDSAFGRGTYRALSLSRTFWENMRLDVQAGMQNYASPLSTGQRSNFVSTTFEWMPGTHFFLESGFTMQRGILQAYDQWFMAVGYRF